MNAQEEAQLLRRIARLELHVRNMAQYIIATGAQAQGFAQATEGIEQGYKEEEEKLASPVSKLTLVQSAPSADLKKLD